MHRKGLLGVWEQLGRKECRVWPCRRALRDAEHGTARLLAVSTTALPGAVGVERKALPLHSNDGTALKAVDCPLKNTFL